MPSVKRKNGADLTPSLKCYLMAGCPDRSNLHPVRLDGWLDTLLLVYPRSPALLDAWRANRDELMEEAQRGGFRPFGALLESDPEAEDVLTPDPRRQAWSDAFCAEWGY
jgi:hypothetical protein